jgi:hypothetical protein
MIPRLPGLYPTRTVAAISRCRYDAVMTPEEIPSPCVRVCLLNEARICIGCGRSGAEIALWPGADAAVRRAIVEAAAERRRVMNESGA